jgi:hypothetical protein
MIKQYIKENVLVTTIILFTIIFVTLQLGKPKFIYNADGSLKPFGIAYQNKTVFPLWLLSICIAILCSIFVRYYILSYN